MSACCTVCVRGYPASLPPERVVDKLMIHFLRARNGGGEIVNIEFAPESPDCAMVTFEDAIVAQRVLKAKEHILSVNGKNYPLEVTMKPAELNPDEIFVCVNMKIDYGRFPSGKDVLCHLQKQYEDVHFNFDSQEMICSVKGAFTVLQAFSSELLRSLKNKQSRSLSVARGRSSGKPAGDGASDQEKTQREKKGTDGTLLPVQNLGESHIEPVEDFSLVIDSDIYLYMQTFCCKEVNQILGQHKVNVVDVSSDGVTTLYLQVASSETGGVNALVSAHLAISQLSQQLEDTLRKEKISKKELGVKGGRGLQGELQKFYPQLLCHEDHKYFYLVGNSADVSQAKLHVQELIAARRAVQDHQKLSALQSSHLPLVHGQSAVPAQLDSPAESMPSRLSSPTSSDKTEHKLAAKFSSRVSLSSISNQETPLVEKFPRDFLQTVDYQIPGSELQFLAAGDTKSESQVKQPIQFQKATQGMKGDLSFRMSGSTVSSTEGYTRLGLERPSSNVASCTFRSLNLFDTTGCVDHKVSEPRPFLRRCNSLQKPLNSSEFMAEPQIVAKASVDHLKQEVQEQDLQTLQREISKEQMSQITKEWERESQNTEQRRFASTSLTVQRDDGDPLDMKKTENLARSPDYIWDSFSYSELAIEGPEDETLKDLCKYLKDCHDQVLVNRDRYRLSLAYPREVRLQIQEAFRFFSDQRMASLSERLHSGNAQQGKSQDEIQKGPQQLKESSRASLPESLPGSGSLVGEKLSSQAERFLGARSASHPLVHDLPSDWKVWHKKCLDKTADASKQGHPKKSATEVIPGLPDKFHFTRSSSKEGGSCTAERAPQSLPVVPQGVSDIALSQKAGRHTLPAAEGVASTGSISSPYGCVTPVIPGNFTAATLSQSLPGYFRDPTLKLIYDIPDGVQKAEHPHPGCPYRGERFEAFLPDNIEGRRLMLLLRKAFERGLTFQIQTCGSEERVVWGTLPHKTSMEGGKSRNGYPDAQYLQCLHLKLKELGIE